MFGRSWDSSTEKSTPLLPFHSIWKTCSTALPLRTLLKHLRVLERDECLTDVLSIDILWRCYHGQESFVILYSAIDWGLALRQARLSIFDGNSHLKITLAVVNQSVARPGWNRLVIWSCSLFVAGESKRLFFVPVENSPNFHHINIILVVCFEKLRYNFLFIVAKANVRMTWRRNRVWPIHQRLSRILRDELRQRLSNIRRALHPFVLAFLKHLCEILVLFDERFRVLPWSKNGNASSI